MQIGFVIFGVIALGVAYGMSFINQYNINKLCNHFENEIEKLNKKFNEEVKNEVQKETGRD